jgi:hypothetical protein
MVKSLCAHLGDAERLSSSMSIVFPSHLEWFCCAKANVQHHPLYHWLSTLPIYSGST